MKHSRLSCLWLLAALVAAPASTPARSGELPEVRSGAHFLALDDSLSYQAFRKLSADAQLEARKNARTWLSNSRTAVNTSRGLRRNEAWQRFGHAVTMGERREALQRALNAAATAVGYCPYMAEAWIQYADVANVLGQYETSMACIAHARKTIPYERSEKVRQDNLVDLERVRAFAAYNVGKFDAALDAATTVLDERSGEWEVRLLAARCMIRLKKFREARRLIATFPEDQPSHATALGVLGVAELEQGNYEEAEAAFDRAAEKGLRDPTFENDRGRLYLATGNYREAIRHFRRAADSTPNFFEAASNVGVAQKRAGQLDAAQATLTELLSRAPAYAPAHFNLAEVYRQQAGEADADARQALARRAWTEYNLALQFGADADEILMRRATLSVFLNDLNAAEDDLLSLSGDPEVSVHVLTVLARVKKDQGRLDIAERVLEMATGRDDATALAFAELGEVRLRRNNMKGAREALEKACVLDPALVVSRVNLSIACEALGDMNSAWAALDEAIALDPKHPLVLERIETQGHGQ